MTLTKHLAHFFLLILIQSVVNGSAIIKTNNNGSLKNVNDTSGLTTEKRLFGGSEERNLEQEILQELNHLSSRKQREIFDNLEKQHEKLNISHKSLVFSETENLSPLNLEELKNIRKTIKTSNSTFPAIRNKRTLNFLLLAVARAMGYTLTPTNPDAEWIPRQQPPPAQPCSTPAPPCRPSPPSTPPPCTMPPTSPPCPASNALVQVATVPSSQIDANTISYPYRPARTIPLFNFAPLPAGVRVPYPPLLQPLAQQRTPCTPQQPSPSPCTTTPVPSPPPCGTTPAPSPSPCATTPAPSPPCGTTPAPSPPPCRPTPAPSPPPCGTTPAPSPPPCATTPASPPSCGTTPAPSPPPCKTTPAPSPPPCMTTPAPSPPCATTPAPSPPPCSTPAPPCATPSPAPCGNPPSPSSPPSSSPSSPPPPPPPPPSSNPPKKGSILLEYDDPVRIQIFSNDKKYLPASGSIYRGHDDDQKEDWHSYFYPVNEKNSKNDEDIEEKEEMEEEHVEEEEEEEEAPGQLKHYEEEDERTQANNEEEDESETSLSIIKKPIDQDIQKTQKRRIISSKSKALFSNDNEKENTKHEKVEKLQKMKKPKRKKWIRIVKKQRRKTKADSNPHNNFQIYTSDTFPEGSEVAPRFYGKRQPSTSSDSYEKDASDYSDDSSSQSSEEISRIDLKKIIVNNKELTSPELRDARRYEFNFNPYALEPEEQRRKKLEKAVEKYVEDYVEKQLGDELIKNTGVPKTTVFEFAPKNGPKIQTITTTVAKASRGGNPSNFRPQIKPDMRSHYRAPAGSTYFNKKINYGDNTKKRGNVSYDTFTSHV